MTSYNCGAGCCDNVCVYDVFPLEHEAEQMCIYICESISAFERNAQIPFKKCEHLDSAASISIIAPKMVEDSLKLCQNGPTVAQDNPRSSKMALEGPKMAPTMAPGEMQRNSALAIGQA